MLSFLVMISIRFFGVRGSYPTPYPAHLGYGGNTSCILIEAGGEAFVIDAGTGISKAGAFLERRKCRRATIFLSHLHVDHIAGLPSFLPFYRKGVYIRMLFSKRCAREDITRIFSPPYFPISMDKLPSKIEFTPVDDHKEVRSNGVPLSFIPLNHPNGALGIKIRYEGREVAILSDNEPSAGEMERLIRWVSGANLLIAEAQYTPAEYRKKRGFGHSPFTYPIEIAFHAGVKRLILTHHDFLHSDKVLDKISQRIVRLATQKGLACRLAREGMKVTLR